MADCVLFGLLEGQDDRQFEIYLTDISVPNFKEYHERMQPFLLFYVDAASYIDTDDDKWSFYTVLVSVLYKVSLAAVFCAVLVVQYAI
jgi:Histone acetyl transferase HAT1 N-terminus